MEDRVIWWLRKCPRTVGCRGVIYKYWTGYNGDCSQILSCVIWVDSIIKWVIRLNDDICEYWWWNSVDWITLILTNVLGGSKVMECGVIICFWSEIFAWHVTHNCVTETDTFLGSYCLYIFVFLNPLWIFLPRMEIILIGNNYLLLCNFNYRSSLRKCYWRF